MGVVLKTGEMISILAMRSGLSEDTMKRVYKNMIDLIKEEIAINGEIQMDGLGKFTSKFVPGRDRKIPMPTGGYTVRWCEPTIKVKFSPALGFRKKLNIMARDGDDELTIKLLNEIDRKTGLNLIKDKLDNLFEVDDEDRFGSKTFSDLLEEEDVELYEGNDDDDDLDDDDVVYEEEEEEEYYDTK